MKTAQDIADYVGGTLYGDAETEIQAVGSLERAEAGALAYAENKYLDQVAGSRASCVFVPSPQFPDRTVIVVDQPRLAFAKAARWLLSQDRAFEGVHPSAVIASEAALGENIAIGAWTFVESGAQVGNGTIIYPGCYIGRSCRIGADCVIYPHVVLYSGVEIGNRVILHAGTTVGSDGFGFVFDGTCQVKVPQVGHVTIGSDVEIGANSCIDRGALDETVIGEGVKIDNLCQIAHNVQIGPHTTISSQTGVAGSSRIGSHAMIGGQVGIADYCRIDDHAIVGAQCGVPSRKRVPSGEVYWGTPARPLRQIKEQQAHLRLLPKLTEEVRRLRDEIDELRSEAKK